VSEVIDGSGNIAAHYEYDPFGNAVVATGSSVASNPWRFSTKPVDAETGYSYYGYRYYSPVDGRWVNRDPIEEKGGVNLYGFVANNPVTNIDKLGELPIGLKILAVYSERSSLSIATFILNRIPGTFHFNDDDLEMVPLTKNALDTFYENWVLEQSKTGKITTKWNYLDLPKTNLATGRWGIFGGIPLISTKWWLGETTKVIGSGKIEVRCQSNDFQFRKRAIALTWYDVISAKDNGYTAFDLDAVETFVNRNLQPILANSFVAQIHYLDNREELHTVLGGK